MTKEEAITNLKMIRVAFVEPITEEQGKLIDDTFDMAIKALEQEPKIGHWIELGYVGNDNYNFECSECHHTDTQSKEVKVNYCWYCGARMGVKE